MVIKYVLADDVKRRSNEIIKIMNWAHIDTENVSYIRSFGSTSRNTIARCHALGKAMQIGMNRKTSFYLIEVIAENFDKLSENEKIKVIIHELMHIPKTFGGGFIHHNKVNDKTVELQYKKYIDLKLENNIYKRRENKWY